MTSDVKVELIEIGHQMNQAGLSKPFIAAAVETAFEFEGVYDLMKLWVEEKVPAEKDEIVADIQDLINDCTQKEKVEGVYVRFDDLARIAKNIRGFKDSLRIKVDDLGGVGELSKKNRDTTTLSFSIFQLSFDSAPCNAAENCEGIGP